MYDLFEQYEEVVEKNKKCVKKITKDIPINKILSLDSQEVLQLESDYSTDDIDLEKSLETDIALALNVLKDREKDVLKLHFGIGVEYPMGLSEIANKYKISKERVRQIKEKAIRRLRHKSRSNYFNTYVRKKDFGEAVKYGAEHCRELTRVLKEEQK